MKDTTSLPPFAPRSWQVAFLNGSGSHQEEVSFFIMCVDVRGGYNDNERIGADPSPPPFLLPSTTNESEPTCPLKPIRMISFLLVVGLVFLINRSLHMLTQCKVALRHALLQADWPLQILI